MLTWVADEAHVLVCRDVAGRNVAGHVAHGGLSVCQLAAYRCAAEGRRTGGGGSGGGIGLNEQAAMTGAPPAQRMEAHLALACPGSQNERAQCGAHWH